MSEDGSTPRWGRWPGGRTTDVVIVVAGLALSWLVSVALDGAASIAPHWFYLPIMWAGLRFGRRGALLTGLVAVAVAGPLLPADTDSWSPQPVSDWVSRGMFFVGIGLMIAHLFVRLRRAGDSERRAAELRTRMAAEARFRVLVETSHEVVTVLDADGGIVSRDGPVSAVFGPAADQLDGRRLDELLHPEDRARMRTALEQIRAGDGGVETLQLRIGIGDGGWRHVESTIRDLRADPAVGGLVLTSRDVTDRKNLEAELEHRATHDALTGLPNRSLLAARFGQALHPAVAARPVGLLLVDLDRFKEINDTHGHETGDELLVQVAGRLTDALRGTDTVARLGGDEFAVLLPDADTLTAAQAAAAAVAEALQSPFLVGDAVLSVAASIGVVLSGEHGTDPAVLLRHADRAMYTAKRRGGSTAAVAEAA